MPLLYKSVLGMNGTDLFIDTNKLTLYFDHNRMEAAKINVQVNFQQIMDAVKQLSPKEKLKLNELIWQDDIDIPIQTQKLVLDRIKYAREHPETMLDWDEASKTLAP